jgi:hypothetical protein
VIVRKAVSSWSRIFNHPVEFQPPDLGCGEFAGWIKKFLGSCPSDSEEAIMAFQSIKKLLPPSCKCLENGMIERLVSGMLEPDRPLPTGYLAFCRKVASEIFVPAWDSTYRDHCFTTNPPLSSTLENERRTGGGLNTTFSQHEFLQITLGTLPVGFADNSMKPMVVQSAGKPRPLSKFSDRTLVLKPLHKALYDRLSSQRWLCRGDLKAETLDKAGFKFGFGSLVSGDYKSATDNLPLAAASAILEVALANATRVSESVSDYARSLLRPIILWGGEEYEMSSGQQMGSLLSFPLLCLQNYVAFRWALRSFKPDGFTRFLPRDVPVLINGDDILFQADDPRLFSHWVKVVGDVGLEVETTKTSFSSEFGSLNSTLVRWNSGLLRVVPTLRFGLLRPSEYPNSLWRSFEQFAAPHLGHDLRFRAGREFLSWHSSLIRRTGVSCYELGFRGRLAWRLFGLLDLHRIPLRRIAAGEKIPPLPPLPSIHNVVLTSDLVDWVPSLNKEEEILSSREMSSWKWNLAGTFRRESASAAYWMALSRPPVEVDVSPFFSEFFIRGRYRIPVSGDPLSFLKKKFLAPRHRRPNRLPFFSGLDRLPSYDEVQSDALLDSGPDLRESFGVTPDKKGAA